MILSDFSNFGIFTLKTQVLAKSSLDDFESRRNYSENAFNCQIIITKPSASVKKNTSRVFPKPSGYILTVLERFEQFEFLHVYRYLRNRGTEYAGPRILKHHKTSL